MGFVTPGSFANQLAGGGVEFIANDPTNVI